MSREEQTWPSAYLEGIPLKVGTGLSFFNINVTISAVVILISHITTPSGDFVMVELPTLLDHAPTLREARAAFERLKRLIHFNEFFEDGHDLAFARQECSQVWKITEQGQIIIAILVTFTANPSCSISPTGLQHFMKEVETFLERYTEAEAYTPGT